MASGTRRATLLAESKEERAQRAADARLKGSSYADIVAMVETPRPTIARCVCSRANTTLLLVHRHSYSYRN